jgi:CHAD domain-containing protein
MDERARTASRIGEDFDRRLAVVVEAARRVREGGDGEAIHDLRVGARRLSEALTVWDALLDPDAAGRARRTVRRLRRRLGAPRETEVNLEQLEALLPGLDLAPRLVAEPLLERLRRRVERRRERARRAASAGRIDRLVGRVVQARARLAEAAGRGPDPLPAARARAERRRQEARQTLAEAAGQDDDALLHRARIAIKKDRYAEEILAAVDSPSAAAPPDGSEPPSPRADALRRLQQTLGTVHDRAMLAAWIERRQRRWLARGRHERAQALAPLLERLAEERRAALRQLPRRLGALSAFPSAAPPAPASPAPSAPAAATADGSAPAPPTPRAAHPPVPSPGS